MDTPGGKRVEATDPGDRISGLPNKILHHVMSFLTARDAVRTCVLSPRWHRLWASAPCLNVDTEGFTSQSRFIEFVNALLLSRGSTPLESFWLCANGPDIYLDNFRDTAYLWICHALRSNVEELGVIDHDQNDDVANHDQNDDIDDYTEFFHLEHCPFTSSCLKKLHLCYVNIDNHAIKKLFSGCPALEDLEMINCEIDATEFSSAKLKSLSIDYVDFNTIEYSYENDIVVINMPSLASLHIGGLLPMVMLSLVDVQSLITASIHLDYGTFTGACSILGALSNAKKLELMFPWEVEEDSFQTDMQLRQVMFANLTSLSLSDWCLYDNCKPMLYLLQHSPNLEHLTLKIRKVGYKEIDLSCRAAAKDSATPFSCEKLRKVEIVCPKGNKTAGILVTILLTKLMPPPEISIKPFSKLVCAAAADSATPFNCEKLRKVKIVCPKGDKIVGMLVTILLTKLMSPPEISIKPFSD